MRPIRNDDILKFPSEGLFNNGFIVGLDFDEVRQDAHRRPLESANRIEELLNRFRTVRPLNRKFSDCLQSMPNALFVRSGFRSAFESRGMIELIARILLFGLR